MRAYLIPAMSAAMAVVGCQRQIHLVAMQEPDAGRRDASDAWWQSLTADRIATGLAHFLWQQPPDATLIERVRLRPPATPAEIGVLANDMLLDRRGMNVAQEFLRYWWGLRDVTAAIKNATAFPNYEILLREEVRQAFEIVVRMLEPELSLLDLLAENRVAVNDVVAPLYGMSEASGTFVWRELGPTIDATAILPLPAVMALLAGRIEPHISRRGAGYLTQLFCVHRPAPHGEMPPSPPMPAATMRQRLHVATRAPGCSDCHDAVDNLGALFDRFDAVGAYRETAQGQPIVLRGFLDVAGDRIVINDVRDLARKVTSRADLSTLVERCYAAHWLTFALGRPGTTADPAHPDAIQIQGAASANGRLRLRATISAVTETRSFWGVR